LGKVSYGRFSDTLKDHVKRRQKLSQEIVYSFGTVRGKHSTRAKKGVVQYPRRELSRTGTAKPCLGEVANPTRPATAPMFFSDEYQIVALV